jgi:hypothetical protein
MQYFLVHGSLKVSRRHIHWRIYSWLKVGIVDGQDLDESKGWFREGKHGREVTVGEIRVEPAEQEGKFLMTAIINGERVSHEITQKQYDKDWNDALLGKRDQCLIDQGEIDFDYFEFAKAQETERQQEQAKQKEKEERTSSFRR